MDIGSVFNGMGNFLVLIMRLPSMVINKLFGMAGVMTFSGLSVYLNLFLLFFIFSIWVSIGKIIYPFLKAKLKGGIIVEIELPTGVNIFRVVSKKSKSIKLKLQDVKDVIWRINPKAIRTLPNGIKKTMAVMEYNTTFSASNLAEFEIISKLVSTYEKEVFSITKQMQDISNTIENIKDKLKLVGKEITDRVIERIDDLMPADSTFQFIQSQARVMATSTTDPRIALMKIAPYATLIIAIGVVALILYQQVSKPTIINTAHVVSTTTTTLKHMNLT